MGSEMSQASFPVSSSITGTAQAATSGLEGAFRDIPGVLGPMLVAFGRNGINTVEDLAACATDDLVGWTERHGSEIRRHPGILGDMMVSRQQCDAIILQARVRVGWIDATALRA
jgi:N utilization substance protein A